MSNFDPFAHLNALRPAVPWNPAKVEGPFAVDDLASLLGGEPASNLFGEHLRIRKWYAEPAQGPPPSDALGLLLPRSAQRPAEAGPQDEAALSSLAGDPERWLFLDTETTGLAGGSGTYAFLVGLAWWDAGGLQTEQLFLRDFTEEHSLLSALAGRLAERPVLVTFNGKTFDWPLLETRYRMTRRIPPPALAVHLDLLHPARQLWRQRWGSVRLCELERNVLSACGPPLGWSRTGDVPGEAIPHIYFEYLRGGRSEPLRAVLRHNAMDLRGLAALAGRVIALLGEPETAEADGYELYGVSRMVRQRAPHAVSRARVLFTSAVDAGLPQDLARKARWEMARLAKREEDYDRAVALWQELAEESPPGVISVEACEQLAMHHERQLRDPRGALVQANRALAELRGLGRAGLADARVLARIRFRLYERIARLEKKTERSPVNA